MKREVKQIGLLAIFGALIMASSVCLMAKVLPGEKEEMTPEQVLGQYKIGTDVSSLVMALEHPHSLVRKLAATILGQRKETRAVPALQKVLSDENENVRIAAAVALQKLGSTSGLPVILQALQQPDPLVRISAAIAVCELEETNAYPIINDLLSHEDTTVRVLAVEGIGRCENFPDRLITLSRLVHDGIEDVRLKVLVVLSQMRDKKTIPVFLQALRDPSSNVRFAANMFLEELTHIKVGYQNSAPAENRERAISHWEDWWERHRDTFEFKKQEKRQQ